MEKNWRKVFLFVWATENQSLQAALSQVWPEWKAGHSIGSFYLKDKAGVLGTIRFFSSSLISVLYYSKGLVTEMFFCYKTLIHWVFKLNNSLKYMFLQGTGNQITCIFWVLTRSMHGCRQIPETYRFCCMRVLWCKYVLGLVPPYRRGKWGSLRHTELITCWSHC